jgi:hypothetical protein
MTDSVLSEEAQTALNQHRAHMATCRCQRQARLCPEGQRLWEKAKTLRDRDRQAAGFDTPELWPE